MIAVLDRMRTHLAAKGAIGPDAVLGIRSSIGKSVSVETDAGKRDIVITATTDDVDLDEEVVVPSGADTTYFFANGQVFADHQYEIHNQVGGLRKAMAYPSAHDHRAWKIRIRVTERPIGDDVLTIAREFGIGASIGFSPVEYGPPTDEELKAYTKGVKPRSVVRRWRWLETSLTAMPCNVSCQGGVVTEPSGQRSAMLDELVTKGRIRRESAAAFGLADAMPKARIVVPDSAWRTPIVVRGLPC